MIAYKDDVQQEIDKSTGYFSLRADSRIGSQVGQSDGSISVPLHRTLPKYIREFRLSERAALEVATHYLEYRRKGCFRYSVERYEDWVGQRDRQRLSDFYRFLERIGIVKTIRRPVKDENCTERIFLFPTVENHFDPVNSLLNSSGIPGGGSPAESRAATPQPSYKSILCAVLPNHLLVARSVSWVRYCERRKLPLKLDLLGSTVWGAAVRQALSCVEVPRLGPGELVLLLGDAAEDGDSQDGFQSALEWSESYLNRLEHGNSSAVSRVRGRVFHALTCCPKSIRRKILMRYGGRLCPTVTIDMHATYWCLLVAMLADSDEKTELIGLLQSRRWYDALRDMAPAISAESIKVQTQMQCLFWREPIPLSARPLWTELATRWPALASLIIRLRREHGVSGLSDLLMVRESRLFIDTALVSVDAQGIPVLPFHDALLVPDAEANRVKLMLEGWANRQLGFTPAFKVEANMELNNGQVFV